MTVNMAIKMTVDMRVSGDLGEFSLILEHLGEHFIVVVAHGFLGDGLNGEEGRT